MIQKVGMTSRIQTSMGQGVEKKKRTSPLKSMPYVDSFVRNSVKSTPALLVATAAWSAIDHYGKDISWKAAAKNNLTSFFAPVLIGSSLLLSIIENKKTI